MVVQLLFALMLIVSYSAANPMTHVSAESDDGILIYIDESFPDNDSYHSADYELNGPDQYFDIMSISLFATNGVQSSPDDDKRSQMDKCMELHMIMQSYNENDKIFDENDVQLMKDINASLCN